MDKLGTNGYGSLQDHLEQPQVAAALHRLLDKMEKIETAVARLEGVLEQAPGMVSMTTDTMDTLVGQLKSDGVYVEERLKNGLELLVQLTEPKTANALNRLLSQMELLADLSQQAPGMIAMTTDMVDEVMAQTTRNGIDLQERLQLTLQLVERLTAPQTMKVVSKLLDNIGTLEAVLEQAPGMVGMAVDLADELYSNALQQGVDLELLARQGMNAGGRFVELLQSKEVQSLMQSGVLDPKALDVLGCAANALIESQNQPKSMGLFAVLMAGNDPDIKRALGFGLTFAKYFGRNLQERRN